MSVQRAYIGLGSNLNHPRAQLERALEALAGLPDSELVGCSPFYRSAPMGPPGQPDYLNAVAALDTRLEPEALLDALQAIEQVQGRVRLERWGPRTLDLDILLYGKRRIDSARLTVPHSGIAERAFVLYPLADLAPQLTIPALGSMAELKARCAPMALWRLDGENDSGLSVLS